MRTSSLRRTALVWMTILLALVGAIAMLIAYQLARSESAEFLDGQLRQVALNAGRGLRDLNAPPAADQDPEDSIAVTIWKNDTLVHSDLPISQIARPRRLGYADVIIAEKRWRSYATRNDVWMAQVAQRETVRQEIAQTAAIGAAAPILIVIPLSWLVVGFAMNRLFGRLDAVARDLAQRSAAAAAAVPLDSVPTEVVPLVEGINSLIVRLRAAIDGQKRFLSDAAHELRTPLAAMQIQVDTLAAEPPERFEQGRMSIAKGVARTTALVNQLLQLARLDESTAPHLEPVELGPLLLECVSEYVVLAENKRIDLGASIDEPVTVNGSPLEMRSLFANLIDNAVRYTPTGGRVDVRLYRRDSEPVVDVLDTGQGLKPGSEAHIFDRFYRAAPAGVDGTGLGLAIARRIAERHGLGLTVENRTDDYQGVLARVTLPL